MIKVFRNSSFFLLLLAGLALAQPKGRGGKPLFRLIRQLDLTQAQQEKLARLRREHQKKLIPLRSQLELKRIELEELFDADKLSEEALVKKVREIGELQTKMMLAKVKLTIALRKILTPEQVAKLKAFKHRKGFKKGARKHHKRHKKARPEKPLGKK